MLNRFLGVAATYAAGRFFYHTMQNRGQSPTLPAQQENSPRTTYRIALRSTSGAFVLEPETQSNAPRRR